MNLKISSLKFFVNIMELYITFPLIEHPHQNSVVEKKDRYFQEMKRIVIHEMNGQKQQIMHVIFRL